MHISWFRPSKTPTKGPPREGENENCGGRREKKSEILGGPAEGCPAEGCPVQRVVQCRGLSSAEGCPVQRVVWRKIVHVFGTKTEQKQNEE